MRCLSCHYDLRNLPEHRCPECGRAFDPNDPRTYDTEASARNRSDRRALVWAVSAFALTFILALLVRYVIPIGLVEALLIAFSSATIAVPIAVLIQLVLAWVRGTRKCPLVGNG